jgi:hypothetical protein
MTYSKESIKDLHKVNVRFWLLSERASHFDSCLLVACAKRSLFTSILKNLFTQPTMAHTPNEQEQRLLDEKENIELYKVHDLRTRTRTRMLSWLTSPPRLITCGLLVYAIISTILIVLIFASMWNLRFKPYCKLAFFPC